MNEKNHDFIMFCSPCEIKKTLICHNENCDNYQFYCGDCPFWELTHPSKFVVSLEASWWLAQDITQAPTSS